MNKEHSIPTNYKPGKQIMPGGIDYPTFLLQQQERLYLIRVAANWRKFAFFCLIFTLSVTAFYFWESQKPKLLPYIIEVDSTTGSAKAVGLMQSQKYTPAEAEIHYFLYQTVYKLRSIPSDKVVLRKNITEAYTFLDDVTKKVATTYLQKEQSEKAKINDLVSLELRSVTKVAGTQDSYHLRWVERTFDSTGNLKSTQNMFGNFTIKIDTPKDENTLKINPLGIYITDFSWSKET